jgi:hypothetical protein
MPSNIAISNISIAIKKCTLKSNTEKNIAKRYLVNSAITVLKLLFDLVNQTEGEWNFRFIRTVTQVPLGFFPLS